MLWYWDLNLYFYEFRSRHRQQATEPTCLSIVTNVCLTLLKMGFRIDENDILDWLILCPRNKIKWKQPSSLHKRTILSIYTTYLLTTCLDIVLYCNVSFLNNLIFLILLNYYVCFMLIEFHKLPSFIFQNRLLMMLFNSQIKWIT